MKLTFSSPVATAEFSKFAGILSAALSQRHLSGFELAQVDAITSTSFVRSDGLPPLCFDDGQHRRANVIRCASGFTAIHSEFLARGK